MLTRLKIHIVGGAPVHMVDLEPMTDWRSLVDTEHKYQMYRSFFWRRSAGTLAAGLSGPSSSGALGPIRCS
jgi:hypothetical protein